ncbi:MAG: LapA family protein [Nitrospirales bacterium]|nr:LapA family protein [Nitrospirales bacterium]
MKKLKSFVAIVLGALVVLIAFQNMASVELNFLFWTFETRRIVLIAICVVIGFFLDESPLPTNSRLKKINRRGFRTPWVVFSRPSVD